MGPAPAELALTDDDHRALLLALYMEHVAALAQVAEVKPQGPAGSSRAVAVGAATAHQAPAQVGRVWWRLLVVLNVQLTLTFLPFSFALQTILPGAPEAPCGPCAALRFEELVQS